MITKCSKCGHQKIVSSPLYSSPAIKCDVCGDYFYESKFKEAALYPPPVNVKESQHFMIYVGGVIGVFLFLFGIVGAIVAADASHLRTALIGLIMFGGMFYLVWSANKEYRNREETYQKALAESKLRLKSKRYQDLLISCSDSNETIIKLLEQYNRRNHIVFTDDTPLPTVEEDVVSEPQRMPTAEPETESCEKQPVVESSPIVKEPITNTNQNLFCRKCGARLFDDSVFCHRCGEQTRST